MFSTFFVHLIKSAVYIYKRKEQHILSFSVTVPFCLEYFASHCQHISRQGYHHFPPAVWSSQCTTECWLHASFFDENIYIFCHFKRFVTIQNILTYYCWFVVQNLTKASQLTVHCWAMYSITTKGMYFL